MTGQYLPVEKIIAGAVATLAQLGFIAVFSIASVPNVRMEISDEASRPIAVAITPVSLLKLGGGSNAPGKLPKEWQRQPKPVQETPLPSPQADKSADKIPDKAVVDGGRMQEQSDAAAATPSEDASLAVTTDSNAPPGPGSPEGTKQGTETDPLKARAVGQYRAQLAAWFLARFNIPGKIPFERLKTLHATATVRVGQSRQVFGFSVSPSGDPTFDAEVRATLEGVRSSGAELPPPPPMYPDILGDSLTVSFQCTVQSRCE